MNEDHRVVRFPLERRVVVDTQILGAEGHSMNFLAEPDITAGLEVLEASRVDGEGLSLTAWLLACFGRAVAEHPEVHACLDWRGRLVLFDAVDVTVIVEVDTPDGPFPLAHVVRDTHLRDVADLTRELRSVKRDPHTSREGRRKSRFRWLLRLPRPVRLVLLRWFRSSPWRIKRNAGTALITSIPVRGYRAYAGGLLSMHNLAMAVGGIVPVAGLHEGRVEERQHLCLTFSIDHDVVDGGPAVRFIRRYADLLEGAALL